MRSPVARRLEAAPPVGVHFYDVWELGDEQLRGDGLSIEETLIRDQTCSRQARECGGRNGRENQERLADGAVPYMPTATACSITNQKQPEKKM
jgi:hypothetical protein